MLATIEPIQIADWLKKWDNKLRMRQAMLAEAKMLFNAAIGAGQIKTNPAAALKTPSVTTARHRLTLDTYKAIIAHANPILARVMNLALITGQRRGDVMNMSFNQVKDGYLWVIQSKAKTEEQAAKIRIPLGLHLSAINMTLGSAIAACRTNVVSRYMIHYTTVGNGHMAIGDKVRDKYIEHLFREAREAAGITGKHPPTFHEIRSLSGRLHRKQGTNVKTLLGHKSQQMSDLYQDDRGAEWQTIAI